MLSTETISGDQIRPVLYIWARFWAHINANSYIDIEECQVH